MLWWDMEILPPFIVKARTPSGETPAVHCDTRQKAEEVLIEFRRMYGNAWVEDANGRKIGGD